MKKCKCAASLLLIGLLIILSGCQTITDGAGSSGSNGNAGTDTPSAANTSLNGEGRFVETDITPEGEEVLDIIKTNDGKLILFTEGMKSRYDSSDGGTTWERSDGPGAGNESLKNVRNTGIAEDGTIYAVINDYSSGEASRVKRILPDGTIEDFVVPEMEDMIEEGKTPSITSLRVLPDNKIYLSFYSGGSISIGGDGESETAVAEENDAEAAEDETSGTEGEAGGQVFVAGGDGYSEVTGVFDTASGEKIYGITDMMGVSSAFTDGEFLYLAGFGGEISVRGLADGKEVKKIKSDSDSDNAGTDDVSVNFIIQQLDIDSNGTIYTMDNSGIYRKDTEGGTKEEVLKSAAYTFGSSAGQTERFLAMGEKDFILKIHNGTAAKVYRYTYDADAVVDPEKELNVWTLKENSTIRAVISAFMKKHPDAKVNLEVALGENSTQEAGDAIRNLNTRILAGDGPDIVVLDGTPAESYADKGMLLDLTDKVDVSEVYANITEPLKLKNGTFYVPAKFKAPILIGAETLLDEMDSIEKYVSAVINGKDKPAAGGDDMFTALAEDEKPTASYSDLDELLNMFWNTSSAGLLKDSKLDTENLKTFFEAVKSLSDKFKLTDQTGDEMYGAIAITSSGGEGEAITGGAMEFMSGRAKTGAMTLSDVSLLSFIGGESGDGTGYAPFPGLSKGSWMPSTMLGINAKSGKQDFAAEFLQTALSEAVQMTSGGGFPVTQKGYDAQLENLRTQMEKNGAGEEFSLNFDMEGFVAGLSVPVMSDDTVKEIVYEAAKSYCGGESDIDSAASKVETETRNYLAERA